MAINTNLIRRPSDRSLFLAAAIGFPLLVLIGYFKTYYFSSFFSDARPIPNFLVHAHGIIMTLWVVYFAAQIALVRAKSVKLHMRLGMAGIALAVLVVVTGLWTAYDSNIVRESAPAGIHPYSFFMIPLVDMILFVIFFGGAIYFRKRAAEHKTLMLMTALNFLAPALARLPFVPPEYFMLWTFGTPVLIATICLVWHSVKHRRINKVFAAAVFLLAVSHPLRLGIGFSESWIEFVKWFVS